MNQTALSLLQNNALQVVYSAVKEIADQATTASPIKLNEADYFDLYTIRMEFYREGMNDLYVFEHMADAEKLERWAKNVGYEWDERLSFREWWLDMGWMDKQLFCEEYAAKENLSAAMEADYQKWEAAQFELVSTLDKEYFQAIS